MIDDKITKLRDFLSARLAEKNQNIFMEAHLEELIAVCNEALRRGEAPRGGMIPIRLQVRPMLVSGMLATDDKGPIILINSEEEPPHEQVITLWHEVLHLLGMTDEFLCDEYAMRLADAAPDILRRLAHNINVPDPLPVEPPAPSDDYNELAALYVCAPNATWKAWAEERMKCLLKATRTWHPELNPDGRPNGDQSRP